MASSISLVGMHTFCNRYPYYTHADPRYEEQFLPSSDPIKLKFLAPGYSKSHDFW
jgi:hypothetical protein